MTRIPGFQEVAYMDLEGVPPKKNLIELMRLSSRGSKALKDRQSDETAEALSYSRILEMSEEVKIKSQQACYKESDFEAGCEERVIALRQYFAGYVQISKEKERLRKLFPLGAEFDLKEALQKHQPLIRFIAERLDVPGCEIEDIVQNLNLKFIEIHLRYQEKADKHLAFTSFFLHELSLLLVHISEKNVQFSLLLKQVKLLKRLWMKLQGWKKI